MTREGSRGIETVDAGFDGVELGGWWQPLACAKQREKGRQQGSQRFGVRFGQAAREGACDA